MLASMASAHIKEDEKGNRIAVEKELSINVRDLCYKICKLAKVCYSKNKERFNFFNYNLVDIDRKTRTMFGLKK